MAMAERLETTILCRYLLAYLVNIWCVRILCVVCTRLCIFKSSVIYACQFHPILAVIKMSSRSSIKNGN